MHLMALVGQVPGQLLGEGIAAVVVQQEIHFRLSFHAV
jgi:hypothetical protein